MTRGGIIRTRIIPHNTTEAVCDKIAYAVGLDLGAVGLMTKDALERGLNLLRELYLAKYRPNPNPNLNLD